MKLQCREVKTNKCFYVAMDGTEFDSADACLAYEQEYLGQSYEPFMALPKAETSGEAMLDAVWNPAIDDHIYFVYIDSEETKEIVNRFLADRGTDQLNENSIGSVQMILTWSDEQEAYVMGNAEENKKAYCEMIDEHAKAAMGKRIEHNNELLKAKEDK